MTLGELRRKSNKTQRDVADMLHVSERTIKSWEASSKKIHGEQTASCCSNLSKPSISNMIELAKILNTQPKLIYECFSQCHSRVDQMNERKSFQPISISQYLYDGLRGSEKERLSAGIISVGEISFSFSHFYFHEEADWRSICDIEYVRRNGWCLCSGVLFCDNDNNMVYFDNIDMSVENLRIESFDCGVMCYYKSRRNILTNEVSDVLIESKILFIYDYDITRFHNPIYIDFQSTCNGREKLGRLLKYRIRNNPKCKEYASHYNKDRISRLINGTIDSYKDLSELSFLSDIPVEELFDVYLSDDHGCFASYRTINYGINKEFASLSSFVTLVHFLEICMKINEIFGDEQGIVFYDADGSQCDHKICVDKIQIQLKNGMLIDLTSSDVSKVEALVSECNAFYPVEVDCTGENTPKKLRIEICLPYTFKFEK